MTENDLAYKVIGIAIDIHNQLRPGLLESAYQECLFYKIKKDGFFVEKEKSMPLIYEDVKLDCGYRIDYLKLGNYKLGLLINFNTVLLKSGIKRIINGNLT
jgi:hypothetical protein